MSLGFGWRAAAVAAVGVVLASFGPSTMLASQAAGAPATAAASPSDVVAGTTGAVFSLTVRNGGATPLTAVRVTSPSNALALRGGFASGWSVPKIADDVVEFHGSIPALGTATLRVVADVLRPSADTRGTWGVGVSGDGGESFVPAAGTGNTSLALVDTVRVLRLGRIVVAPDAADDGSATAGQPVSLATAVTNEGAVPLTVALSGPATGAAVARGGRPSPAVVVAPGETSTLSVPDVVLTSTTGAAAVRLEAVAGSIAAQSAGRMLTIQTPVEIKPRNSDLVSKSFQCDRQSAYPAEPLQCSVLVDKKAGDAAAVLGRDTALTFDDSDGGYYEARLVAPVTFPEGTTERVRLDFEAVVVPAGFNFGYYRPLIKLRGVDGNGAVIDHDRYSPERILMNFSSR